MPHTDILCFWKSIESLVAPDLPKLDAKAAIRVVPWDGSCPIAPWAPNGALGWPAKGKQWKFTVYCALFPMAKATEALLSHFPKTDVFDDRPDSSKSCVFALTADPRGEPIIESFSLSMHAWMLGSVLTKGSAGLDGRFADTAGLPAPSGGTLGSSSGFAGFDTLSDHLREYLSRAIQGHKGEFDLKWYAALAAQVIRSCHLEEIAATPVEFRVECDPYGKTGTPVSDAAATAPDETLLSSFYIKELGRIALLPWRDLSAPLKHFLSPYSGGARFDVRLSLTAVRNHLNPSLFPIGRWPTKNPLVYSQLFAVNSALKGFRDGDPLFSVNGPPGTGKTTLLRDVIAAVVSDRASVLAKFDHPSKAFSGKRFLQVSGRSLPYFPLDEALQRTLIVVASSNNGAVENISLELPTLGAIDPQYRTDVDYFPDLMEQALGEPSWALIAAKLGNKGNRNDFVSKVWWSSADPTDPGKPVGLRQRLIDLKAGNCRPLNWSAARARFDAAIREEAHIRAELRTFSDALDRHPTLERALATAMQALQDQQAELAANDRAKDGLLGQLAAVAKRQAATERGIAVEATMKPGMIEIFLDFFQSPRERPLRAWRTRVELLRQDLIETGKARESLEHALAQNSAARAKLASKASSLATTVVQRDAALSHNGAVLNQGIAELGAFWPKDTDSDDIREKTSPWCTPDWEASRIEVFLSALMLHRAFIENCAQEMGANLGLAMDALASSKIPDREQGIWGVAFDSLALLVPVISTTFASSPRLLSGMSGSSIGFVLIDESGQASPHQSIPLLWRAQNALVVGDPLQLEPVVKIPAPVEEAMAMRHGGVDPWWWPRSTSVQKIADYVNAFGTTIPDGDLGTWVGAPLRVHRRCDDPMFSICNQIAYDGLMVHGKLGVDSHLPLSGWIHVAGDDKKGNLVLDEIKALDALLHRLMQNHAVHPGNVFLVSPFRDVTKALYPMASTYSIPKDQIGTVHTAQGKEAQIVIVVLGGGSAGARAWAASKPNLLNVAVSRAKQRLYVIGHNGHWSRLPHFEVAARYLPQQVDG